MFSSHQKFPSSEGSVWKYVFTTNNAVAEAVLYRYESFMKRTVICCSVMSGCPVGCTFCGTGKRFIRNLTADEIVQQIETVLQDQNISARTAEITRFQIMFMSMGEPMLNWTNVEQAIRILHQMYPNAELLISTVGIDIPDVFSRMINLSKEIPKVGLQFSIHHSDETKRNILIPFKKKVSLRQIRDLGMIWSRETGRPVYLNYCIDGNNVSSTELDRLMDLFTPMHFHLTFSVICSADEKMKEVCFRDLEFIQTITAEFVAAGYNVRIFDPAGQDDIGGGCGQLWYVQRWMQEHGK